MGNRKQENTTGMEKRPRRKLIGGLILLIVLCGLYGCFLFVSNLTAGLVSDLESRAFQVKALGKSTEKIFSLERSVIQDAVKRHLDKVTLEAGACHGLIEAGEKLEPCMYQDGAIIRVRNGSVELPAEFPKEIHIEGSDIKDQAGLVICGSDGEDSVMSYVFYAMINDGLCYIEWRTRDDLEKEQQGLFDQKKAMTGIEKAFGVNLMVFSEKPGMDGKHHLIYLSNALFKDGLTTAEDYGITQEMISKAGLNRTVSEQEETQAQKADAQAVSAGTEAEAQKAAAQLVSTGAETETAPVAEIMGLSQYRLLTIEGKRYELFLQKHDSATIGETVILTGLIPIENGILTQVEPVRILLVVFLIIGVFYLIWYCATLRLVRDHSLNERQKKEFSLKAIIRRSISIIVIGCVIILLASAMLFALFKLYSTCQQVETAFSSLQQRISENSYAADITESTRKKTYEGFAEQITLILENQPEYADAETLQFFCDLIGADYIMLFDSEGRETVSNSRYVGLSLGKDPSSSTYDFRRLLTGTELITHDLEVDEATGEKHVRIGVSYGNPQEGEKYGALLLAVPGEQIYDSAVESVDDVMTSFTAGRLTAFSVDPESNLILHASNPSLVGRNVLDLGLPEKALHAGCRDFFTIAGKSSYVQSEEIDSVLYYYIANQADIYSGIWGRSVLMTVAAAVLLAVFALFLLFGYGKFFAVWSEVGEKLKENEDEVRLPGGRRKHSKDPSVRWEPEIDEHGIHAPVHIARLTATVLLVIGAVFLGIRMLLSVNDTEDSLLSFIIQGQWTKGVNLFAFTSILILFFEVIIAVALIKILLRLISNALGTKGETICRLLISLANYSGIILFVYFSLYYLGLQPGTLLASLGLMSFAISLGAKDLITDIIAGLSIVFEGEYQVGDIIDVAGYRGEVLEIGVRTTKLEGQSGNIKIISNRDIKNVINMTRMNSWCTLNISVSSDADLENIEKLLREQLPHIGESVQQIVSGPIYKGVVSIGKGTMTLAIDAECSEGDYYHVQNFLNRAIQKLFAENGIKIM